MFDLRLLLLPVLVKLSTAFVLPTRSQCTTQLASSMTDDFANFAASLEQESEDNSTPSDSFESTVMNVAKNKSWQEDLDELLNPLTPVARKQVLLSDLAGANADIQASIQTALRDGKVSHWILDLNLGVSTIFKLSHDWLSL